MKPTQHDALRNRLMVGSMLMGVVTLSAGLAFAQETTTAAPAEEEEARQEAVITTGSRIAIPDYSAISPVTSIGSEQIELSATLNLESLVNELPQVIPGNTVTSNNAGGEDFATVDLRGLGPQRTLVLIDGERAPPASATGVVDINSIPAGLVERIEVVTGGASAVYGSDALAGVINFILKDDYEGGEVTVSKFGGFDGNGGGESFDFLLGGNFDSGKGNIVAYGSHFNREGVLQSEYDYSAVSAALVYGYNSATGQYTGIELVDSLQEYLDARARLAAGGASSNTFAGGGSGTPPWGSITNNAGAAGNPFRNLASNPLTPNFASANTDCNPATPGAAVNSGNLSFNDQNQLTPFFSANGCAVPIRANGSSRYNFAPDNYIFLPFERTGIQTFANYELTPSVQMKAMLSYSNTKSQVQLAPTPITELSIPVSSPAISGADGILGTADDPHRDLSAALLSRGLNAAVDNPNTPLNEADVDNDGILNENDLDNNNNGILNTNENFTYAWRSNSVGPRVGDFNTDVLMARVAFLGDFSDTWSWNVSAGWSEVTRTEQLRNNVNRIALLQGVAGCANIPAAGRLPNCTNVDIFGPGVTTPEMANFIRTDVQANNGSEQTYLNAYVTGSFFELPAGPIAVVGGLEYRQDEVSIKVDDAQRRGEIAGFNAVQDINGELDVYEAYSEVVVPILKDVFLAKDVSLEGGYRLSDYSTVGQVESYKYGGNWSVTDWLRFRGIYNVAVRAPSAFESFQNGDQGFPSFVDPCRASATGNNAALRTFCSTNGSIRSGSVPASLLGSFAATNSQVQAFSFGNPNLGAEEGETLTLGFVFEPDFLPIGNFKMTADYFDITLSNRIGARGAQTVLDSCYGGLGANPQSAQDCQAIVRDPASGQVIGVDTSRINAAGETQVTGYDVQADYAFDLNEILKGLPGSFDVNVLLTVTDKFQDGEDRFEGASSAGVGGAIPDWRTTTTMNYRVSDWVVQVRHVYVPGLAQLFPSAAVLPDTPEFSNFDLGVSWDVTDRLRLVGNVSNVFDEFPPQTVTGFFDQANTDAALYAPWVVGRTFSVQARYKF